MENAEEEEGAGRSGATSLNDDLEPWADSVYSLNLSFSVGWRG